MNRILFAALIVFVSSSLYSQNFTFTRISPEIVISSDTTELVSYALLQVQSGTQNIIMKQQVWYSRIQTDFGTI